MEKGELMNQVKQQIALANAQEMLSKMTEKCFKKCIQKPGKSLTPPSSVAFRSAWIASWTPGIWCRAPMAIVCSVNSTGPWNRWR